MKRLCDLSGTFPFNSRAPWGCFRGVFKARRLGEGRRKVRANGGRQFRAVEADLHRCPHRQTHASAHGMRLFSRLPPSDDVCGSSVCRNAIVGQNRSQIFPALHYERRVSIGEQSGQGKWKQKGKEAILVIPGLSPTKNGLAVNPLTH